MIKNALGCFDTLDLEGRQCPLFTVGLSLEVDVHGASQADMRAAITSNEYSLLVRISSTCPRSTSSSDHALKVFDMGIPDAFLHPFTFWWAVQLGTLRQTMGFYGRLIQNFCIN